MKKEAPNPFQLSMFNRYPTNYQSNVFTESRQEFSELEKKIVTMAVNQLGNQAVQGKIQPDVNVLVTIPYSELTKDRHNLIFEAAEALSKKRISLKNEQNLTGKWITPFPYVESVMINGRRFIQIKIMADVVPHFAALGQRYTKYDLDIMMALSSVYAQRMFEIVSMNFHIKKLNFSYLVEELRNILNCPETYRYNDFKVNVLEVAQRELRQKANLLLEWEPIQKIGKRVIELEFRIMTVQQLATQGVQDDFSRLSEMSPNELVIKAYEVMSHYQLKAWQKDAVATDRSQLEILFRVHSEFMNGLRPEVKNRNKYLAKSLGLDLLKPPKTTSTPPAFEPLLSFIPSSPERRAGNTQSIGNILIGLVPSPTGKKEK
jgi:plasmid replication initiation protein